MCFKAKFTIYYQWFFAFTVLCNADNTRTLKACVTHASHVGYVRPVKKAIELRAYVTGEVTGEVIHAKQARHVRHTQHVRYARHVGHEGM